MATLEKVDESYLSWIGQIIERYRSSQIKAAVKINREMLRFYWSLGKDIVRMKLESVYGDGILERISLDLKRQFPSAKGFSVTNLNYMKRFYLTYYHVVENHPQLVGNSSCPNHPQSVGISLEQLFSVPWGHHRYIIDHFYNASFDIPLFYVRQTIEHGLSRDTLLNLMDANLHLREGKAISNFEQQLPPLQSDLGQLGTYVVAVDEILRSEQDNQTIGLLICKTKDEVLAKYALKASNQPIGVSEYTLNQILPEQLKDALPSVKDLQEHLEK